MSNRSLTAIVCGTLCVTAWQTRISALENGEPPAPLPDRALARFGPFDGKKIFGAPVFSPDGKLLAIATESDLHLWNVPDKKLVRTMRGSHWKACFSPDGKTLATIFSEERLPDQHPGSVRNFLILWESRTTGKVL